MAHYAIVMTKLEVNGNLVTLQPGSYQLFSEEEEFIMKYEVDQPFMNSPCFIVFHNFLVGDVDVAYHTTTNAQKSKPSNCIVFSLKMFYRNK